jgi:hypothetical protein
VIRELLMQCLLVISLRNERIQRVSLLNLLGEEEGMAVEMVET